MRFASSFVVALPWLLASTHALAQGVVPGDAPDAPVAAVAPAGAPAAAAPSYPPLTPRIGLRHDLLVDVVATGVMAGSLLTWGILKTSVGIDECVICDGAGGEVNALDAFFRDNLRQRDGVPAATISHVLSYGVGPIMGVALTVGVAAADHRIEEAPLNALLVVEASLAAVLVKEAITAVFRRERPIVHAAEGDAKAELLAEGDPLESFPGGHTTSIMAITAATATIATLRGYRLAPLVWIIGSTLGVTSAYLRIAADQHYFTDNLAGAAVGIGVGAGLPLLFHGRLDEPASGARSWLRGAMVTSSAVPGGRVVGVGWAF